MTKSFQAFLNADIPLYKLRNDTLVQFLELYTGHTLPSESTLREKFVDETYSATIDCIRDEIKDGPIWVCIDETTDKDGRSVYESMARLVDLYFFSYVALLKFTEPLVM